MIQNRITGKLRRNELAHSVESLDSEALSLRRKQPHSPRLRHISRGGARRLTVLQHERGGGGMPR